MSTGKKFIIFYIYLEHKFKAIEERVLNSGTVKGNHSRSRSLLFLEKAGVAAITTLLLYSTVVYMNLGKLILPDRFMLFELTTAFLFLLCLFYAHRKISGFVNSGMVRNLSSIKKAAVEVMLVVFFTLLLHFLFNYFPLKWVFSIESFDPVRVRTAIAVSITVSLFFYYFVERENSKRRLREEMLRSARLQKENYEAQIKSLKNQVNPHFLFNSLNVLSSLIRKDKEQATEFLHRLAEVYRSFLDYSQEQLIPLQKEMELTNAFIYLQTTRFGSNMQFKINIPEDSLGLQLPPGSLQLLVENAIKHNASTARRPLLINIFTEGDKLVVRNNLQQRKERFASTKTGLNNIVNRYRYLTEHTVEIEKSKEEFTVKIPLLNKE